MYDSDDSFAAGLRAVLQANCCALPISLAYALNSWVMCKRRPRRMESVAVISLQSPVASALAVEAATAEFMQQYIDAWLP